MKILLTGGTGGLGREVVRAAEAAGHTVRIASRGARPSDASASREWARMDLQTGDGVPEALAVVDAVIHAASDPRRHAAVDVQGTRLLAEAARKAGTPHLVYVSIVGVDEIPLAYYHAKHEAERILAGSGVPHSILRATQFHPFVEGMIAGFARMPLLLPLPAAFRFQPVATAEAAERLVRAAEQGPGGRLPDFGGPEVLTLGELARAWKAARGVHKPILPLRIPGALAAAFRAGKNTLHDGGERGTVRWQDWLRDPDAGRGTVRASLPAPSAGAGDSGGDGAALSEALRQLRAANEPVPAPARLPTAAEVDAAERALGVRFHPDYRRFLLEASDVVVGTLEPAPVLPGTEPLYLASIARGAWEVGLPRDLLPIVEDNGDYYCMAASGEDPAVVYWSHDGTTEDRWASLAEWITKVWIGES
jgi:uncharacterized protein YbjT (DUF2867 family)